MTIKHTPTPWKLKHLLIVGGDNHIAGVFSDPVPGQKEANAKFILRACNNHDKQKAINDKLIKALKKVVARSKKWCKREYGLDKRVEFREINYKIIKQVKQVLAEVKE